MKYMKQTPEELKQYLIGNLPEVLSDEIELQIISGEISEETMLFAEDELIEDFLEKNLSSAELDLFQKNFLISPDRESKISQISHLKNYAQKHKAVEHKTEEAETGFFQKLTQLFSITPLKAAFALIIVGVFISAFWFIAYKNSPDGNFSALEQEYAKLNKTDLSGSENLEDFSRINLVSGKFRGKNGKDILTKQNLTEKVFMNIALPKDVDSGGVFRIELINDGETIFTQETERVYQNTNGKEIKLLLPGSVLQRGVYHVFVKNSARENLNLKYGFSID